MGTEGLAEGPGQARTGGGGPPSPGSPRPPGPPVPSAPTSPVCEPRCTCCSHKPSQGPHPTETLGRPSPAPGAPGWGRRGLADPSSFSYSFNFSLLLKGAQSSGLGSLGSPLETSAGGSSLPHPRPTPTSPGADQDTTEDWRPHLALKCNSRMELGTLCWSLTFWGLSSPSGWKSGRGWAG